MKNNEFNLTIASLYIMFKFLYIMFKLIITSSYYMFKLTMTCTYVSSNFQYGKPYVMFKLIIMSSYNKFKLTMTSSYVSSTFQCSKPMHYDELIYYVQVNYGKPICFINFSVWWAHTQRLSHLWRARTLHFNRLWWAHAFHPILDMASPCIIFKLIMVIPHSMFNHEEFTQTLESPHQSISLEKNFPH